MRLLSVFFIRDSRQESFIFAPFSGREAYMKFKTMARHAAGCAVVVVFHAGYTGTADRTTVLSVPILIAFAVAIEVIGYFRDRK